jgi:regulatory protein YycI of two-component signal transduction system YycFG
MESDSEQWVKHDIFVGEVWNFWNFEDKKKIQYIKTCFTWINMGYFSIEHQKLD